MTKYKASFYDLSQQGGYEKLQKDGFKRSEVMGAVHYHTRGMDVKEKREFVRNFVKKD